MSSQICPKCGKSTLPGSAFCANCGSPLATPATAPQPSSGSVPFSTSPAPATPPIWYPQYTMPYYELEKRQGIDRTKTGLMLLVIGFLISWIPFINFIGTILELVGAVLVILGRHAFGGEHSRNVLWSIIIFIVGIVAGVVAAFVVIFSAIASNLRSFNQNTSPTFRSPLFDTTAFFVGILIGVIIAQISYVLLTFALQKRNGRILLLVAYPATIVATFVNFFILRGDILLSALPSLAPSLLYAYAYNLARSRVGRGEIPGPVGQPPASTQGYVQH